MFVSLGFVIRLITFVYEDPLGLFYGPFIFFRNTHIHYFINNLTIIARFKASASWLINSPSVEITEGPK